MFRGLSICIFCLLLALSSPAQDKHLIDSLQNILKTAGQDTTRVRAWNAVGYEYRRFSWDSTYLYSQRALKLSRKIKDRKGEAMALNNTGISFHFRALYDSALWYYRQALEIRMKTKELKGIASCHTNMGIIFYLKGEYDSAMGRHRKAFEIQSALKDTNGLANTSNNMASVWRYRGNYEKALELFIQALKFYEKSGDMAGRLYALNNVGIVYATLGKDDLAIKTYREGIALAEKTEDAFILAVLYTNLGIELLDKKQTDEAITYFEKGYVKARQIYTQQGIATCAVNLGRAYLDKNQLPKAAAYVQEALDFYQKSGEKQGEVSALNIMAKIRITGKDRAAAEKLLQRSISICKEVGLMDHLETAYFHMYSLYKDRNDPKTALHWFKLHSNLKDSLLNSGNSKTLSEMEARFETEKKEKEILVLEKQQKLLGLELQDQKNHLATLNITLFALAAGLGLGTWLVILVIGTLRKRKQSNRDLQALNLSIISKKEVIEQHNEEIGRNLQLAREIQSGILPSDSELGSHFRDHFLLFRPKELVSGDFYWVKKVPGGSLVAVVDCTGHGVPGAYMSVMAYEFMEALCRKDPDAEPALILRELNERLFRQQQGRSFSENPGLDISVVKINADRKTLLFASSRQPLWILEEGSHEVKEIRPEKKFLGLHSKVEFAQERIAVKKNDAYYLFSDGYSDQIGEQSKKKMLVQRFREQVSGKQVSMTEQKDKLSGFFEEWKGNKEQVDDVTVLGFKV